MMLKLVWRNLWRNGRRTTITVASIAFAVLFAIFMQSYRIGVFNNMIKNVVAYYSGYIQVHQQGYWNERVLDNCFELTESVRQQVKQSSHVTQVVPRIETFMLVSKGEKTKGCLVVGTDPVNENNLTQLSQKVIKGTYLRPSTNDFIIGEGLSERLGVTVNDTIVLYGQGYQGVIAAGKFKITGILRLPSPPMSNTFIYLPLKLAQQLLSADDRITSLSLGIDNVHSMPITLSQLKAALGEEYEVMSWEEMMPELSTHVKADTISFSVFVGILYLIIAFGFFGTVLMMTVERKNEFGMLLAIGMKKSTLKIVLLTETFFISLMGVLFGVLISLPIVIYLSKFPMRLTGELAMAYEQYGFEPVLPTELVPSVFYLQSTIVMAMALLVGIYPLIHVERLAVIQALKK